jgi:hypothetical protein
LRQEFKIHTLKGRKEVVIQRLLDQEEKSDVGRAVKM